MYNKYKYRKCAPHLEFYECLATCSYTTHLNFVWGIISRYRKWFTNLLHVIGHICFLWKSP